VVRRGLRDRAVSRSPLLWLNLVCLDAPLVAICWQWIFAHSFHLSVPVGHRAALFLTAWVIYLADRFGDSVSLVTGQPKSVRQQFCLRHRSIWLVSIICVAVLDVIVVLRAVDYETAVPGAVLGAFTIAYLAINHAHSEIWETIPLKEFIIGSLFAAGTLLGVTPHIFAERSTMIFAAILFAALCSLNCISIAIWERDLDRIQGKHSIATRRHSNRGFPRRCRLVDPICRLNLLQQGGENRGIHLLNLRESPPRGGLPRQNAGIAQLVEQLICNQQVVGSNPTAGSIVNQGGIPSGRESTWTLLGHFWGSNAPKTAPLCWPAYASPATNFSCITTSAGFTKRCASLQRWKQRLQITSGALTK
jgi:hypothetical protein